MPTLLLPLTALLVMTAASPNPDIKVTLDCSCRVERNDSYRVHVDCHTTHGLKKKTPKGLSFLVGGTSTCEQTEEFFAEEGYLALTEDCSSLHRVYRTSRPWQAAAEACARDGARLAVAETQREADAIAEVLEGIPGARDAWVGLHRAPGKQPNFVTVTDEPLSKLSFRTWAGGEGSGEDCVSLTLPCALRDVPCAATLPFVCERQLPAPPPRHYRPMEGSGASRWVRLEERRPAPSREAAQLACHGEGGGLAVARDERDADHLLRLMEQAEGHCEEALLGLTDTHGDGDFYTDQGEPMELLDFHVWFPDQPLDTPGTPRCVALHRSGMLKVTNCSEPSPYFCEWRPTW